MTPCSASSWSMRRPCGVLDRRGAAHHPAGAVAGRAERLLHAARLADQHPAGAAHVAGDDHRLADLAVRGGRSPGARRERPAWRPCDGRRRVLRVAVDPCAPRAWRCCGPRRRPGSCPALPRAGRRHSAKHLAGLPHQQLPVAPGEVGRGAHRARGSCWPSGLSTGAQASCRSGSSMPYFAGTPRSMLQRVVADLVAQPARAGVDHHADHVLAPGPSPAAALVVEHLVDDLHLEEVVARAERAALVGAALERPVADAVRARRRRRRPPASVCSRSRSVARPRSTQVARRPRAISCRSSLARRSGTRRPGPTPAGIVANSASTSWLDARLHVGRGQVRCAPAARRS